MSHTEVKRGGIRPAASAEAFCLTSGDFNAVLKRSAEKLLPVLGQHIQLRLFCASGVLPTGLRPSQIEDMLSCFFAQAKEELQAGGTILLQTGHLNFPGGSRPHIVLKFGYTAGRDAGRKTARFAEVVQAVDTIVEQNQGFVGFDRSSSQTLISIYLPSA